MRRTKQESQQTRLNILVAARRVFARTGVTRTTLEHVAAEAGVTRGAIYWHFANKRALFDAMREQMSVPMVERTDYALLRTEAPDPIAAVDRFLRNILDSVVTDEATRQTLQIMVLKCEYVDEFEPELARQTQHWHELEQKLVRIYRRARRQHALRADLSPSVAALDTCVFVSGLLRLWLIDEQASLIRKRGSELIAAHIAARRAPRRHAARSLR